MSASGCLKAAVPPSKIYVRSAPNTGHSRQIGWTSAFDPKETYGPYTETLCFRYMANRLPSDQKQLEYPAISYPN